MHSIPVLIASTLKPLKDPRAYYRFGLSLRETNKYLINIIGFSIKNEDDEKNIKFHPLFLEKRKGLSRILASYVFYKVYRNERPRLCIICTWEFIPAAVLCKFLFGGKLVYDVQENYTLNISYNRTSQGIRKWFAKTLIQVIEYFGKGYFEHFIFSEQCYIYEKPAFHPNTILENKFYGYVPEIIPNKRLNLPKLRFLISGTITEVYGIREALQWFIILQHTFPEISLLIIGHCPISTYREKLIEMSKGIKGIELEISYQPISYERILGAYGTSDIVLLPYHQIPSISPKIPSKLYECLALGKPVIFSPNTKWRELVDQYGGGMEIDFKDLQNAQNHFRNFLSKSYFNGKSTYELTWPSEEKRFLTQIQKILNPK
ncbi:glycosyltransferase [Cecembia rubra]|uniref:Glycosyltransferase involved in cell wall biosynthesis n=1 Tax=Cecembia rubra TaxID=1485585 RepID=A0A2P8EDD3_9BACT|nr:glycosyltransferase [Cecembia rubra]PSL07492.1 glycosyltransferase involved in cell wall biosynthesis [Cecembia rubra]